MIKIVKLKKVYFNTREKVVFDDFNLQIKKGDSVAILGPNGIGKTTLLRIISGLEEFQSGKIIINDKRPSQAKIGFIPQNYSETLLPWYTNIDNIILPLHISGVKINKTKLIENIENDFNIRLPWNDHPYNLSGGQKQMLSIMRAVINNPDILLMDEPFSSLDISTSIEIQKKLRIISKKKNLTSIFVSHRVEDCLYMSNRILLLKGKPTRVILDVNNSKEADNPGSEELKNNKLINKIIQKISN